MVDVKAQMQAAKNTTAPSCEERMALYNSRRGDLTGYDCPICRNKGFVFLMKDGYEYTMECAVSSIVSVSDAFDVSDVAFVSEAFSVDTTEALSVSTTVSVSVSAASSVLSATSTTTACCPLRLSAVPASAKADNVDGIINAMTHIADINFFIFLYSFVVSISVIIISYSSLPVAPSKCNLFSQIYGYFFHRYMAIFHNSS